MLLPYDSPVKTNHMIGVLNTILLQLDLKVMNSDLLNMRQITLPMRCETCLRKEKLRANNGNRGPSKENF